MKDNAIIRGFMPKLVFGMAFFSVFISSADASTDFAKLFPSKALYIGVNMGGGSTEWKYLVDKTDPVGQAQQSTPTAVSEGGPSWGVVLGYDVSKNFAIELQYMQFADANIQFAQYSLYTDANDNPILGIKSQTDAYSLSGKFLAQIAHTRMRAFAEIGAGLVQRTDPLVNYQQSSATVIPPPYSNYTGSSSRISCVTPYLSAGLNYSFSRNWMIESGFQYYTGFGASELLPVAGFIPFAWDAYGRLAYQFKL